MFNKISRDMSLNMMDSHERFLRRVGDRFRLRHPHEERAYKSRSVRHCDGIYLLQGCSGFPERFFDHLIDLLYMLSGRDLRHNAAVQCVEVDL